MSDTISLPPVALPPIPLPPIPLPAVSLADLDAVDGLVAEVRWPHRRVDIGALIELGHGRLVREGEDGPALGVGLWWSFDDALARLGLIIVSPEAQGRGLGRRLVEALLADAAPRPVMLLATRAGKPLYDKLGFVETGSVSQHQGEYRGTPHRDPRIRPAGPADRTAIAALDRAAFGTARPEVLDHLLAVGRAAVLVENGTVAGYAVERPFGRGSVIGPVVATSEDDAIALFDALAHPGFLRVDLTTDATRFARHVSDAGLAFDSASPVMVLGNAPEPSGPQRIFGLASHALG
ncbi:N-acetyltransferase [Thalassobaculum fulvum]|uniref:N-acetyltransferase n=1 Tax=Thalassobaculum fulvum TaxID=1633335 RepID=A0A918XSH0_9PROT|nr:GNAT family N-acetyltransferase [Thalassobaculum fulvum]GHD52428.1 N-acetyltransferase [Thalassobaculum fulvum]